MVGNIKTEDGLDSNIKSHDDIIQKINEIKTFEEKYPYFDINELPQENLQQENKIEDDFNEKNHQNKIFNKLKVFNKIKFKKSEKDNSNVKEFKKPKKIEEATKEIKEKKAEERDVNPTVFNIGYDKDGDLVNLDLKKIKAKDKGGKANTGFLNKILKRGKSEEGNKEEKGNIVSKIKNSFGKIGKIKNAIPLKGKKK